MMLSSFLISCKTTTEYIYPDIPERPVRERPEFPEGITPEKVDPEDEYSDILFTIEEAKLLNKYIVDLLEFSLLVEADKLYYIDATTSMGEE